MSRRGFSLIELLVVMLVIGILAGIAVPKYREAQVAAKAAVVIGDVHVIATAAHADYVDDQAWQATTPTGTVPVDFTPSLPAGFTFDRNGVRYQWVNMLADGVTAAAVVPLAAAAPAGSWCASHPSHPHCTDPTFCAKNPGHQHCGGGGASTPCTTDDLNGLQAQVDAIPGKLQEIDAQKQAVDAQLAQLASKRPTMPADEYSRQVAELEARKLELDAQKRAWDSYRQSLETLKQSWADANRKSKPCPGDLPPEPILPPPPPPDSAGTANERLVGVAFETSDAALGQRVLGLWGGGNAALRTSANRWIIVVDRASSTSH